MTSPSASVRRALVVSLMLNIFLVSGVVGGVLWFTTKHNSQVVASQHALQRAMHQLPKDRRKQLQDLLQQARVNRQDTIKAGHEARMDVFRQLNSPTMDRSAVLESLGKAREADDVGRVRVDETVTDFIQTLSLQERRDFANALFPSGKSETADKQ